MISFIFKNILYISLFLFWFIWFINLFEKAAKNNAFTTLLCSLFTFIVSMVMLADAPVVKNWVNDRHLLTYASPSAPIADSARIIVADHRLSAVNMESTVDEQTT